LLNVRWNPANAELMGIALAILILWTALSEIGSNRLNTLLIICGTSEHVVPYPVTKCVQCDVDNLC
jgi:hypothetical protein